MNQKIPLIVFCFILWISNLKYSCAIPLDENKLENTVTPPPPINDFCSGAIEMFGDGILDCDDDFEQVYNDFTGTGDPEATGNCVSPSDLGVWFTFSTPSVMSYRKLGTPCAGTGSKAFELFSSSSGCSGLVYIDCSIDFLEVVLEPSTQYYILLGGDVTSLGVHGNDPATECDNPFIYIDEGNVIANETICDSPSDLVPCENENVIWYSYTTTSGCEDTDVIIEIDPYTTDCNWGPAEEISIVAVLDDCLTLMSAYHLAGTGFVCAAITAGDKLELNDVPPGTSFVVGLGSDNENVGHFEIIITETDPGMIINDECVEAINLYNGNNIDLNNYCASNDIPILACSSSQSQSSVWFIYNEGFGPQDISIDLSSNGIVSPALAAYDNCNGGLLNQDCTNNFLELLCVDVPIYIEVASSAIDEGGFDLEIISTPSDPGEDAAVTSTDICSGSAANIEITIPNGDIVNITIEISPGSSPLISGMINQTVNGTSNTIIDDILMNNSGTTQEAIYLITFLNIGTGCPPEPVEHSIFVFPAFSISPLSIEECLPHLFEIDIDDIITGGSPPYNTISWFWNGVDPIGTGNTLSYDLSESGTITVEVVDSEGCTANAAVGVSTTIASIPTFDIPEEYCQSDQDYISFPTISLEGIEGTWNPSSIDVTQITTTGYVNATFTPNDNFCSETIIEIALVIAGQESDFDLPSELCTEGGIYIFPNTDLNGNMGFWQISSIDLSTISGVQYNTFVVSSSGCFVDYEYEYEVLSSITIDLDIPESICKNTTSITLNNISQQGYEGTWDISVIDPASTTDDFVTTTWSPLTGQSPCLSDTTITIAITDPFVPTFDLPDELCPLDSIFTFPPEDLQSVAGIWSLETIDPSVVIGSIVSEFTPDDECASVFTWEIEITEPVVPVFDFDTLYCSLDSIFVLPTESDNGILGIWSMPMIIPSDLAGQELTVQFSGSMLDTCVETIETVIYIEEAQDVEFDIADELCWTDENFLLPDTSLNGVSGSWQPSIIDIQANIGQSITIEFLPEIGFCFKPYTQEIEVLAPYIVDVKTIDPSGCNVEDGNITLDVPQGPNFEFSIDDGVNWQSANTFDALSSGGYTILVRSIDNVLCELTIDAYLNSTDGPSINEVVSTNNNDCVTSNGSITIDAEGMNLEYSIDGINWQTTNVFEGLSPGNYEIEIKEALSDCIVVATAAIIDFPETEIILINTNDISDCNASDGSIEIIAEGQALEYSIDNGITWFPSNIFTGLEAGTYEIITQSTEGINCISSSEAVLIEPSLPILLDIVVENPTTCSPIKGSLLINGDGVNIEYSIDGGTTWQDDGLFSGLSTDEYQVIIREKENINCYTETLVPIDIVLDQLEESVLQVTPTSDCDLEDGSIEIINNLSNLEYSIDSGATWQQTAIFDNLSSGIYLIISRKLEFPDCQVEQSIEIPNLDCPCHELMLEFDISNITCDGEFSGGINLVSIQGMTNDDINILWQNGTSGVLVEGLGEGWQSFTIEYDEFCVWTDSVYIDQLSPIQFDLTISDLSCPDIPDGVIEIVNVSGGSNNYMYSLDGENFQIENIFTDLDAGTYEVFTRDETDCLSIENIEIQSPSEIAITLPEIESIVQGKSIILNPGIEASQVDSFIWTPIESIINIIGLAIEVSPNSTTTYTLEVYYGECSERKEVLVEVEEEEDEEEILLGNVFSPNGDGANDILYIQGNINAFISLNQFSIYDRWGNKIFNIHQPQINNKEDGWDGYTHGKLVVSGVYIYLINYSKNGQSEIKMGTVTVVN